MTETPGREGAEETATATVPGLRSFTQAQLPSTVAGRGGHVRGDHWGRGNRVLFLGSQYSLFTPHHLLDAYDVPTTGSDNVTKRPFLSSKNVCSTAGRWKSHPPSGTARGACGCTGQAEHRDTQVGQGASLQSWYLQTGRLGLGSGAKPRGTDPSCRLQAELGGFCPRGPHRAGWVALLSWMWGSPRYLGDQHPAITSPPWFTESHPVPGATGGRLLP